MNKRKITVLDGIKTWPVNMSHVDEIRKIARNKSTRSKWTAFA